MRESTPHFLLYCESISQFDRGTWRFSLECLGTDLKICASGEELSYLGDRLALLGIVRGLEALPETWSHYLADKLALCQSWFPIWIAGLARIQLELGAIWQNVCQ